MTTKPSGSELVAEFLKNLQHPSKNEILKVRELILAANSALTEHIKWNAPSFCHNGDDRITFNLTGKGFFRLIFHRGAKVKDSTGKGRLIPDAPDFVEWAADDRAVLKFTDMADISAKSAQLTTFINQWLSHAG